MRSKRSLTVASFGAALLVASAVVVAMASPASGVAPTLLSRGSFDAFKLMSNPDNGGLVKLEAKAPVDVVVRQHAYQPGSTTGWHAHPYPVLITVKEGTLTFYEYDDPTCTPIVVSAGHGYVDSGRGHVARNETDQPALDISVILAPVGAAFRTELAAPNPYCGF
jgi:quercetin dioxygenase-like cupin family protein